MTEQLDSLSPGERTRFWEDHIQAWRGSGLSQTEYCRRNDLIRHRFWYWRNRIEQPREADVSFVPVALPAHPVGFSSQPVSVITPNGYRIELGKGSDPGLVGQLMRTIREL